MVMPQTAAAGLSRAALTAAAAFAWSLKMLPCLPSSPGAGSGRPWGCPLPVGRTGLGSTRCPIHTAGHSALFANLLHQPPGPCPQSPSSISWLTVSLEFRWPSLAGTDSQSQPLFTAQRSRLEVVP